MQKIAKLLVNPYRNRVCEVVARTFKYAACFEKATAHNACGQQSPAGANDLMNKIAVVIGGTTPFGLVCAKELLKCGVKGVMIADADENEGKKRLCQICSNCESSKVAFIKTDIRDVLLLRNAFINTKKHFKSVDVIINIVEQCEKNPWTEEIETNVRGVVRSTLLGYEFMGTHKGGSGGIICNLIISPSLEDCNLCPILLATRNYMVSFGKAMSTKYNGGTGIKVITGFAASNQRERNSETMDASRESLSTMLEGSLPGSVWTLHFMKRKKC